MKIPLHIEPVNKKRRLLPDRLSVSGLAINAFVYLALTYIKTDV
jgi:hypothetical protein